MFIVQSQYNKDIAAAEERGRASAAATPTGSATAAAATPADPATPVTPAAAATPSAASVPTPEQEAAMAEVKAIQAAASRADDPKILAADIEAQVAKAKSEGRTIEFPQPPPNLHPKPHACESDKIA